MKLIAGIFDRLFTLICVLIFSQAPAFISQYEHRLAGHVEELTYQVDAMRLTAEQTGKTLEQFIAKFLQNNDIDFVQQGEAMNNMAKRYNDLRMGMLELQHASVMKRPLIFLKTLNIEIAKKTFSSFQVSIAFTLETLCYAGVGLIFSVIFTFGLKSMGRRFFTRNKQRAVTSASSEIPSSG